MKVISFGCKSNDKIYLEQVLPSLLSKKKVSTIRPAWKETQMSCPVKPGGVTIAVMMKEPRFKVGDPVKFLWKCRSPYRFFNKKTGNVALIVDGKKRTFPKLLGTGTIIDVMKLEINKDGRIFWIFKDTSIFLNRLSRTGLAKSDGFNSSEDMFTWFDQQQDLTTQLPFNVYRWRWDK